MRHGQLHTEDMKDFLERESRECTCEEHPDLLDPDCTFCHDHPVKRVLKRVLDRAAERAGTW